jgi:hypothetical protein
MEKINKIKKIKTVWQLRKMAGQATKEHLEYKDFAILLGGGFIKSSKEICWDKYKKVFYINNCIDDTEQTLTGKELFTKSNIGKAIRKGCLIAN